jgi:hypothetical protein
MPAGSWRHYTAHTIVPNKYAAARNGMPHSSRVQVCNLVIVFWSDTILPTRAIYKQALAHICAGASQFRCPDSRSIDAANYWRHMCWKSIIIIDWMQLMQLLWVETSTVAQLPFRCFSRFVSCGELIAGLLTVAIVVYWCHWKLETMTMYTVFTCRMSEILLETRKSLKTFY